MYIAKSSIREVTISNDQDTMIFDQLDQGNYLLPLGICEAGEEITIKTDEENRQLKAFVYRFSYEAFHTVFETLNDTPIHITEWTDTSLVGTLSTKRSGVLFTSIPYDKGWSVTVDGKTVETGTIFETFLSVDIPVGDHRIEFPYIPEGLRLGMVISGISILIIISLLGYAARSELHEKKQEENTEQGE